MIEDLKSRYRYNPRTGVLINLKTNKPINPVYIHNSGLQKGDKFSKTVTISGGSMTCAKVCFSIYHGFVPKLLDHIDRDVSNNKINNLRSTNHSVNNLNARNRKDNKSGHRGITKSKDGKKYLARYRGMYLGLHNSLEEAINARKQVEENDK